MSNAPSPFELFIQLTKEDLSPVAVWSMARAGLANDIRWLVIVPRILKAAPSVQPKLHKIVVSVKTPGQKTENIIISKETQGRIEQASHKLLGWTQEFPQDAMLGLVVWAMQSQVPGCGVGDIIEKTPWSKQWLVAQSLHKNITSGYSNEILTFHEFVRLVQNKQYEHSPSVLPLDQLSI